MWECSFFFTPFPALIICGIFNSDSDSCEVVPYCSFDLNIPNQWKRCQALFLGAPKSLQMVIASMKLRCLLLGRNVITNLDSTLRSRHYFANKRPSGQGYGFSSGHVCMGDLDCEESWALKNWCFWTMVLEKTLKSPLDCKEIQPVHPKGDQFWMFIGRTDAEVDSNTSATSC